MSQEIESEDSSDQTPSDFNPVYSELVETSSYRLFRSRMLRLYASIYEEPGGTSSDNSQPPSSRVSAELLSPDKEFVDAILQHRILIKNPVLADLVSYYFNIGESASRFCIRLLRGASRAKSSCIELDRIVGILPDTGDVTQKQCDNVFGEFLSFVKSENPFPNSELENFRIIKNSFETFFMRLEQHRHHVQRKLKCLQSTKIASVIGFIILCIAVVVLAIWILTKASVAIVAGPLITFQACFIKKFKVESFKSLRRHSLQLDAAKKGSYVLSIDLDTLSILIRRVHHDFEACRALIQFCLDRKGEKHSVLEVVNELKKHKIHFDQKIESIQDHICVCLMTINRVRKLLVKEIQIITKGNTSS